MIPTVDGGLAATAANDGVVAMTTTSRLRAAVAERVMATMKEGNKFFEDSNNSIVH